MGLSIARCLGILSSATAAVMDVAIGWYSGKETGETALLRTRLDSFSSGNLLVADRHFCSFFLVAVLLGHGVPSCTRMHQKRNVDFRRGRRLGAKDHLVVWTKTQSPLWMAPATSETIPETRTLCVLQVPMIQPGSRCSPKSPSAKSPIAPAASNPESSNAAATATNSYNTSATS